MYLLTEKICLWENNSKSLPDTKISSIYVTNSQRAMRHPSQLNGRNYSVRHILSRRTPPPPKLNLPLINFGVINILWISARPLSRGQWYYGLIELEVTFLKILQWRSWVGSSLFWFPLLSFYSKLFVSPVFLRSIILWFFFPMESDEDNTPQQQQKEGDTDPSGKKECRK